MCEGRCNLCLPSFKGPKRKSANYFLLGDKLASHYCLSWSNLCSQGFYCRL